MTQEEQERELARHVFRREFLRVRYGAVGSFLLLVASWIMACRANDLPWPGVAAGLVAAVLVNRSSAAFMERDGEES